MVLCHLLRGIDGKDILLTLKLQGKGALLNDVMQARGRGVSNNVTRGVLVQQI